MRRRLKHVRWWLEYASLYFLFLIARLLPQRALVPWGRRLGLTVYRLLPIRRSVVLENLRAAFGAERSEQEIRALARRFYGELGVTLLEFFSLWGLSREKIRRRVEIQGREHLDACRAQGQGAVLISGHFGNWELLGAAMVAYGYPTHYLIKSQANPYVDRMHNEIRRRAGIGVIRQGLSVRQLVYALRRGEFVGILSDQDAGRQGIFLPFLGRPAAVARGPAYMAWRTRVPLLVGVIFRGDDGRHRAEFTAPVYPDPSWDEETAVRELTRIQTERLEAFIRRHPEHYFWVHRRWKTQPLQDA